MKLGTRIKKRFGKIMAILVISAVYINAMSLGVCAVITNGNGAEWDEPAGKYIFDIKKESGGNYSDITGVIIDVTMADAEVGFGGGIAFASDFPEGTWPGFIEWGNDAANKPIVSNGKTLEYRLATPIFTESSSDVIVMIEQWWGSDMTVDGIRFERNGVPAPAIVTTTAAETEDLSFLDETTAAEVTEAVVDETELGVVEGTQPAPTGNTAIATIVVIMAISGVAAVATKKRK